MPTELSVGDPVFLERSLAACSADSPASAASTNCTLEGVVADLGPTAFAGGDWVGVRLTGTSSRGRGRNDGKVKGKRYFVCDKKCGMFVRRSAITKRSLNRIEELRLRREIGSALLASSSPAPDAEQKQMMKTPTRGHRQPSSLQRALSSSKRGQIGIGKRGIESTSHFRTPPPPPPHTTRQSTTSTGADRQKVGSTNANSSTRKSRLDLIRERKAALAASTTNRDTTASHSPHNTTASTTAAETLSGGTLSAEEERNRLAGELSALRGELFALRDENESLRRSLDSRNGGVMASGSGSAAPHTNQMVLLDIGAKSTDEDDDSACLDSLDEVLDDGNTHHSIARHRQQVTSKPFPALATTMKAHSAGFADFSLLDDIKTPAKPDLERRLAKALLKIALLSEELEDLRESKQSGDERTLRDQGEEVLIPIHLEKIRDECPDMRWMPASLPLPLQGIVVTSDWPLFARDIEDEIHCWAKTKKRIPYNATFGTIAASTSFVFFIFSIFVAAGLSIVIATLFLATSCRNFYLSRRYRRKLDILFKEYREKWPGTVIQLSKSKDPRRCCWFSSPCACMHYSLLIASNFDIEQAHDRNKISPTSCRSTGTGRSTHGERRKGGGGGDACNGAELSPSVNDLEEPLLPFVSRSARPT